MNQSMRDKRQWGSKKAWRSFDTARSRRAVEQRKDAFARLMIKEMPRGLQIYSIERMGEKAPGYLRQLRMPPLAGALIPSWRSVPLLSTFAKRRAVFRRGGAFCGRCGGLPYLHPLDETAVRQCFFLALWRKALFNQNTPIRSTGPDGGML